MKLAKAKGVEADYEAGVQALALGDHMRFLGWLGQELITRELLQAWALVVSSLWAKPLSPVALEARAAGAPVIAGAAGGLAELVVERRDGLLLANGDATALTTCLMRIASGTACGRERWNPGVSPGEGQQFAAGSTLTPRRIRISVQPKPRRRFSSGASPLPHRPLQMARQDVPVAYDAIAIIFAFRLVESVSQETLHRAATAACAQDLTRPYQMAATPSSASRVTGSAALWQRQQGHPFAATTHSNRP